MKLFNAIWETLTLLSEDFYLPAKANIFHHQWSERQLTSPVRL